MIKIARSIFAASVLLLSSSLIHAVEVKTVGDFRLLAGQYFFNQSPSSLSGNASFTIVPAIKFNEKFMLIPTYMGSYRGTKEVNDLIGGGTLFQDGQDHLVSLKAVYKPIDPLKLKLVSSYKTELLRETKDEMWGKGLFDYKKLNYGFETEYTYMKGQALRVSYDMYTLVFPNYESLESSVSASGLGRELAGKTVLDSNNSMIMLKLNNTVGLLKTELGFTSTAKKYPDQPLVLADGTLSTDKRSDAYSFADVGLSYPFKIISSIKLLLSFDGQMITNASNQGHYDAYKFQFTPNFYDYNYTSLTPGLNFILGALPWVVSANYSLNRQDYKERLVQDINGNYLADKIYLNETVYGLTVIYPVTKEFRLRILANLIESQSNMKYEKTYSYNYETSNYMMGFSYEF